MKTAICVSGTGKKSIISPSLIKAEYFLILDPERKGTQEKIFNHYKMSFSGADIFIAQLLISKGVNTIVCGSCEKNAMKLFDEANIKVVEKPVSPLSEYSCEFCQLI